MSTPVLEVEDLTIQYKTSGEPIQAVTNASFAIGSQEYFGLVGESGCGKSTIAKALIGGLDSNGEITSGKIKYKGEEIQDYSESELSKRIRWDEIAMIPQASMNSLDPIMRLSDQAIELAQTHTDWSKDKALDRFERLFEVVGLPEERIHDFPHQFSGGMQQRAIIALALFLKPSLIIADEPTTALDVIMQDQILKHFDELKEDTDISLLMITHDISVILESCDRMAIMHGGQVAEVGPIGTIYDNPRHPYSILLQQAFPDIRNPKQELEVIEGKPPQLQGGNVDFCSFSERCPWAIEECKQSAPQQETVDGNENHQVACFRSGEMEELASEYITNGRSERGKEMSPQSNAEVQDTDMTQTGEK